MSLLLISILLIFCTNQIHFIKFSNFKMAIISVKTSVYGFHYNLINQQVTMVLKYNKSSFSLKNIFPWLSVISKQFTSLPKVQERIQKLWYISPIRYSGNKNGGNMKYSNHSFPNSLIKCPAIVMCAFCFKIMIGGLS